MTVKKREKILDRVKKLLRLAEKKSGGAANEMAVASAAAKKLMDEHSIEMAEVTIEDGETKARATVDIGVGHSYEWPKLREYMNQLGHVVAKITTTEYLIYRAQRSYIYRGHERWTEKEIISYLGDKVDVAVACVMYKILLKACHDSVKASVGPGYGMKQRNYCEGFISGLWVQVNRQQMKEAGTTALVLYDKRAQVKDALAKLNPKEEKETRESRGSEDASAKLMGFMAGVKQDIGTKKRI